VPRRGGRGGSKKGENSKRNSLCLLLLACFSFFRGKGSACFSLRKKNSKEREREKKLFSKRHVVSPPYLAPPRRRRRQRPARASRAGRRHRESLIVLVWRGVGGEERREERERGAMKGREQQRRPIDVDDHSPFSPAAILLSFSRQLSWFHRSFLLFLLRSCTWKSRERPLPVPS
jgi:hypothetical protein